MLHCICSFLTETSYEQTISLVENHIITIKRLQYQIDQILQPDPVFRIREIEMEIDQMVDVGVNVNEKVQSSTSKTCSFFQIRRSLMKISKKYVI